MPIIFGRAAASASKIAPFADHAVAAFARLDQREALEPDEIARRVAMGVLECLLATRLDAESHDVECGHGARSLWWACAEYSPAAGCGQIRVPA